MGLTPRIISSRLRPKFSNFASRLGVKHALPEIVPRPIGMPNATIPHQSILLITIIEGSSTSRKSRAFDSNGCPCLIVGLS